MPNLSTIRPVHGGNVIWAATVAGCSPDSLLDFSASISPLGPPDSVLQALQTALPDLIRYPDPGYGALRSQLSAYHQVPSDWILPGNGAAELLTWAAYDMAMGDGRDQTDQVHLLTPAFGDYGRALATVHLSISPIPLLIDQTWNPVLFTRPDLATGVAPSRGLILNNPHNPSGILFDRTDLLTLLPQVPLMVVDEAFMDFLPPHRQQSLIGDVQTHANLVVLRSLTKFFSLPGLRIGYAIGHPDRLRQWQQWRDPWPVNGLATAAVQAAVADIGFHHRTWAWVEAGRQQLIEGFSQLAGLYPLPGSANYVLVRSATSVTQLQEQLLRHHRILIRDCLSFPELGDQYFRVAVRTDAENQQLLKAIANCIQSGPGVRQSGQIER